MLLKSDSMLVVVVVSKILCPTVYIMVLVFAVFQVKVSLMLVSSDTKGLNSSFELANVNKIINSSKKVFIT